MAEVEGGVLVGRTLCFQRLLSDPDRLRKARGVNSVYSLEGGKTALKDGGARYVLDLKVHGNSSFASRTRRLGLADDWGKNTCIHITIETNSKINIDTGESELLLAFWWSAQGVMTRRDEIDFLAGEAAFHHHLPRAMLFYFLRRVVDDQTLVPDHKRLVYLQPFPLQNNLEGGAFIEQLDRLTVFYNSLGFVHDWPFSAPEPNHLKSEAPDPIYGTVIKYTKDSAFRPKYVRTTMRKLVDALVPSVEEDRLRYRALVSMGKSIKFGDEEERVSQKRSRERSLSPSQRDVRRTKGGLRPRKPSLAKTPKSDPSTGVRHRRPPPPSVFDEFDYLDAGDDSDEDEEDEQEDEEDRSNGDIDYGYPEEYM